MLMKSGYVEFTFLIPIYELWLKFQGFSLTSCWNQRMKLLNIKVYSHKYRPEIQWCWCNCRPTIYQLHRERIFSWWGMCERTITLLNFMILFNDGLTKISREPELEPKPKSGSKPEPKREHSRARAASLSQWHGELAQYWYYFWQKNIITLIHKTRWPNFKNYPPSVKEHSIPATNYQLSKFSQVAALRHSIVFGEGIHRWEISLETAITPDSQIDIIFLLSPRTICIWSLLNFTLPVLHVCVGRTNFPTS